MNSPKRHHYVPRFLLANFVASDSRLFVRSIKSGKIWRGSPDNVFLEGQRYSSIKEDGSRDVQLETSYSELEGRAKPVVEAFLTAARSGTAPEVSTEQKLLWDEFFYHQIKRVPAVTRQLAEREGWNERLEVAIARLPESVIIAGEEELKALRSEEGLARIAQNATVKALSAPASPEVRMLLALSTLEVGVAPDGSGFVIGDRPVANAGHGLVSDRLLWLPIAPDVAIRPAFGSASHRFVTMSAEDVGALNAVSAAQSEQIAGNDHDLVERA